jgi:hypothetical protein
MSEAQVTGALIRSGSLLQREKSAFVMHAASLRTSSVPPPNKAPKGTFLHGFLLPFTLIVATMRDRELRGPYVRVVCLRALIVVLVGAIAIANGSISSAGAKRSHSAGVIVHKNADRGAKPSTSVHVDLPGLHVDIDDKSDKSAISVLGQSVPVTTVDDRLERDAREHPSASPASPAPPPALLDAALNSWAWLLALIAVLSATEFVVVFLSRRWDDWLSFHASRLVNIVPEDETPKTRAIALDFPWLYRKLKRRFRGYVVFAAGLPALLPLRLFPTVGAWLFTIAATCWGWYWLGVFSAAKSAHAWADEEKALSPMPIRTLNDRISPSFVFAPLRWYGRLWAKITTGVNPAATTFERSPAAFLGLALARVVLSLPGLYLLARPIVPVAAGRLCAEVDPAERFSIASAP